MSNIVQAGPNAQHCSTYADAVFEQRCDPRTVLLLLLMSDERVVDVEGLYVALDAKRKEDELSWRDAAGAMGVSASTLTRMAQGASPDVEGFGKMVRWLGVSADDFIARKGRPSKKPEQLLVVVSRHLRASKELDPKSAKALEGIIEAAYKQVKDLKDG